MGVPVKYRGGGEANALYDWLDITSGVGYRRYLAGASALSSGALYFLTSRDIDSLPWNVTSGLSAADWQLKQDLDFDIQFKKAAYISGAAYINVLHAIDSPGAGDVVDGITTKIFHVNPAGTETQIASAVGALRSTEGGGSIQYFKECIKLDCDGKQFSVGDRLRLNVLHYGKDTGGNGSMVLYFDPSGKKTFTDISGGSVNTTLSLDVPFTIDI